MIAILVADNRSSGPKEDEGYLPARPFLQSRYLSTNASRYTKADIMDLQDSEFD